MIVMLICAALVVVLLVIIVAFLARKKRRGNPKTSVEATPMEYPTDQKMAFENGVVEN